MRGRGESAVAESPRARVLAPEELSTPERGKVTAAAAAAAAATPTTTPTTTPTPIPSAPRKRKAPSPVTSPKRRKPAPPPSPPRKLEQVCLDVGQRNIGPSRCKQCGLLFTRGQAQDDELHARHHDQVVNGVPFRRFAREKVVAEWTSPDYTRIIKVVPNSLAPKVAERVRAALSLMHDELGGAIRGEMCASNERVYLFVRQRSQRSQIGRVHGCLIVQPITRAYAMQVREDGAVFKSANPRSAELCVNYIWVHRSARRQGVARRMLDAARHNFSAAGYVGHVVRKAACAFAEPTTAGRLFAASYTSGKPTGAFLVPEAGHVTLRTRTHNTS